MGKCSEIARLWSRLKRLPASPRASALLRHTPEAPSARAPLSSVAVIEIGMPCANIAVMRLDNDAGASYPEFMTIHVHNGLPELALTIVLQNRLKIEVCSDFYLSRCQCSAYNLASRHILFITFGEAKMRTSSLSACQSNGYTRTKPSAPSRLSTTSADLSRLIC